MRCGFCEWRCDLAQSQYGICRMYSVQDGTIRERMPNHWYTYELIQVEALPFYHVYPGSRSLALGTTGCNLDCQYCINAYVVKEDPESIRPMMYEFSAAEIIRIAEKLGCHNIVFNTNEPTVSIPSLELLAADAKKAGLPMGCLTNAYTTEEGTERLADIFSFMNISLKGLSEAVCRKYLGISSSAPVVRNIRRLAQTHHLEITTPIIQGVNDGEIGEMAELIASVDRNIPWHVFRLQPERGLKDVEYPSVEGINQRLEKVRDMLSYVYFHNFIGSDWVNTLCPECGAVVIERLSLGCGGDLLKACHGFGDCCPKCGGKIPLLGGKTCWNSKEMMA